MALHATLIPVVLQTISTYIKQFINYDNDEELIKFTSLRRLGPLGARINFLENSRLTNWYTDFCVN